MIQKFRLFDKRLRLMLEVHVIDFYERTIDCYADDLGVNRQEVYSYEMDEDNYVLMQSTGLFDENDKEVYEHDVVNIHWFYRGDGSECEAELNNVIIYRDYVDEFNAPYFFVMDKDEVVPLSTILMHEESIKVLGNIHQHPELLKEDA